MHAKTVFIHSHIRKCGGTTFKSILKQNFGDATIYSCNIGLNSEFYSCEDMKQALKRNDFIRAFSGHEVSLDLPYTDFSSEFKEIKAIAFIRNPVDRILSWYFYRRNKSMSRFYINDIPERQKRLDEYILDLAQSGNMQNFTQSQIYHLSGAKKDLESFLHQVTNLIDNENVYLFPLDRFDEACLILEKKFPNDFQDCSYSIKNVSLKDQIVSEDQKAKITKLVEECLDWKIYSLANNQLSDLMANFFPDQRILKIKQNSLARRNRKKYFILNRVKPFYTKCLIKMGLPELL